MLIEHRGKSPTVDPTAWIAPTAVLCGDVTVGLRCEVAALFDGARADAWTKVRINGVVHVNSTVGPNSLVPIGWVTVG